MYTYLLYLKEQTSVVGSVTTCARRYSILLLDSPRQVTIFKYSWSEFGTPAGLNVYTVLPVAATMEDRSQGANLESV